MDKGSRLAYQPIYIVAPEKKKRKKDTEKGIKKNTREAVCSNESRTQRILYASALARAWLQFWDSCHVVMSMSIHHVCLTGWTEHNSFSPSDQADILCDWIASVDPADT